jgi:pimeloyl-ACP methyl ester carboxylesterase
VAWLTKQIFTSPPIFGPFFRLIRQPRVIRFWVKKAYASPEAVTDELVDLLVGPTHDRGAAQALRAMFMAKARPQDLQYNAAVILPQLTLPMLLIWGRQDQMVPSKLAPLFVQCNPKVQLIELDQAGHCPQDECPQLVNQAILSWINTWNAVPNLQTSSVR